VYKLLLCWRYLRTRYLAMACIISVMLGVATLIVVNSVMSGFSTKLRERLHGLLSDVVVESIGFEGFVAPEEKMAWIRNHPELKDKIEATTATLEVFAMLQYRYRGEMITRPVRVIGIDPQGRASVGGFSEHIVDEKREKVTPSFELSEAARQRYEDNNREPFRLRMQPEVPPGEKPPPEPPEATLEPPRGIIVGFAIASFRDRNAHAGGENKDIITLEPGDDVVITTLSGARLSPVYDRFTVCSYFSSEMSEYDSNYVFVPLDHLQHLRTMENRATSIQIRLKDYNRDAEHVKKVLSGMFPSSMYYVGTWEDKQGPLLAAISIEKGILNVLLFLIIAVAGFGILAIFSMIVVEKTRDIGVLKALGASNSGVMKIFLGYGMLLGLVGAVLGTGLGLALTIYVNEIEQGLAKLTGQDIFDRKVYYFDSIPTDIQALTVIGVNIGALLIAVFFSILPALRAAWLHPVRALRYE
jgi:lipoprotein-releasing system permease protein